MSQNPFKPAQPAAKPKPAAPKLSAAAKDMLATGNYDFESAAFAECKEYLRVTGIKATRYEQLALIDFVGARFAKQEERIEELEQTLAYAQAEAEKALSADLTRHLGETDHDAPKSLAELERMADAQFKSRRKA